MYRLIYVSTARPGIGPADFDDILVAARACNYASHVTGLLVFDGRFFVQYLEGREGAVEATFGRIFRDRRHSGVVVLARGEVDGLRFPGWDMTEKNVADGMSMAETVFEMMPNCGPGIAAPLIDYIRMADRAA
ncbi:MAG: BLUF domain-containing protein [Parasphingopyxis sp.]|uniref:BLUF domain-containing protein n=1 Tax=Parasphingopyxis sp. TaxID=1920299 RepID=UPI003FA19342